MKRLRMEHVPAQVATEAAIMGAVKTSDVSVDPMKKARQTTVLLDVLMAF